MRPIRKEELLYLNDLINDKYSDKESNVDQAIATEAQKQVKKNLTRFVAKLGIKAEVKAFKEAIAKYEKFKQNKEIYEARLETAKQNARRKVEEKLGNWNKIRNWNVDTDRLKSAVDVEEVLKKACTIEAEAAVEKLPKFKVKHQLSHLREEARNILYSGRSIQETWKLLGRNFKSSGVQVAAPKELMQLESK